MSGAVPGRRSGYKLIPQSNSDNSEFSDEELSGFYRDGFQIITKKRIYSSDSAPKNKTVENRVYSNMNAEKNNPKLAHLALSVSTNQNTTLQESHAMSIKRKCSFSFSIFTCFFVIALFLAVPCEWANCSCDTIKNEIWEVRVPNIEFVNSIVLVHTKDWYNMNFLLIARGSIFADAPVIRTNYTSSSGGDIFAFHGLTGQQLWRKHYNKMPDEIDCKLLSLHNTVPKDCMVVSYENYLLVLSPENGRTYWNLPLYSRNNKTNKVFPVVIPDVDHDGVLEIVLINNPNKLQLISGFRGVLLAADFKFIGQYRNCSEIMDLKMQNEFLLKLICKRGSETVELDLPLREHLTPASLSSNQVLNQHYPFATLNPMYVHNYTIQFENNGTLCPKNCEAKIMIQKAKSTVWSHDCKNCFIMTPIAFDLNYSAGVFGFVAKIWKFEHEKSKSFHDEHELTVNFLSEQIFVIVFNHSSDEPVFVINLTRDEIIQLYAANLSIQPDPKLQQYSLIVQDVSRNGSRNLINYYSTFEADNRDGFAHTDYTLKSYVRMYDLLAEIKRNWV